jgi:hypothetical protein
LSSGALKYDSEFKSGALKIAVIFAALGATVGVPSAKTFIDSKAKKKNKDRLIIFDFIEVKFRILKV